MRCKRLLAHGPVLCWLTCGALLLNATGCIQMGAGAAPSTRPVTSKDVVTEVGQTSGSSWALGLFQLQLWRTSTYDAIQKAKRKVGANCLIDVRADNKVYWLILPVFPLITLHVTRVSGTGAEVVRQGAQIQ